MKKLIAILAVLMLTGCNAQIIDTTWHYNYAYITLPEGSVEGEVTSWIDYEDSDMVQVRMKDGTTYCTHGSNIVLVQKGE
jgi:major membrane immunogen (membrane-anchored lipoprotein)